MLVDVLYSILNHEYQDYRQEQNRFDDVVDNHDDDCRELLLLSSRVVDQPLLTNQQDAKKNETITFLCFGFNRLYQHIDK